MKRARGVIILRVLLFMLIPFISLGLYFVFFNLTGENISTIGLIFNWAFFAGIMSLNFIPAKHIQEKKKDFTWYFHGEKTTMSDVYSKVNMFYSKLKPLIVIAYLATIVLFNMECGILKSDGYVQILYFSFPMSVHRIIIRVAGTICFVVAMYKNCQSSYEITLDVCPNCGKVTAYYVTKTQTFVESWTETNISIGSYTTKEQIGELEDSDGNRCAVYGDVTHYTDDSYDVYHPGLYEFEYTCKYCKYSFRKTESK